jgi:hypothetical protein
VVPTILVLGAIAGLLPRGWLLVAAAAVGAAIWNLSRDAYADSGNALGFSLLVVVVFAANGAVGMLFSLTARRAWRRSRSGVSV